LCIFSIGKYTVASQHTLNSHNRTALLWVIMQQLVLISYWHFGTTYWSHLHGSNTQKKAYCLNMVFI